MTRTCAFRVDASRTMGTGHVMRCLTLADELAGTAVRSRFVCRQMPESLAALICSRGHELRWVGDRSEPAPDASTYAQWLGVTQAEDAAATLAALGAEPVDWLVVDHYAL